jgi:hypothetical protein
VVVREGRGISSATHAGEHLVCRRLVLEPVRLRPFPVELRGLEPRAFPVRTGCSANLSYSPMQRVVRAGALPRRNTGLHRRRPTFAP